MSAWTAAQSVNTPRESSTHLLTSEPRGPREPRSSSFYSILPAWQSTAQHGVVRGVAWACQPGPGRAMPFSVVDLADPSCNHTPSQLPTARHLGSFPAGIGPSSRTTASSVRPCFGSVPRPGLCWAGWTCLLSCCLSVRPVLVKIHHQCYCASLLQGSPPLAASLPRSQSSASASSLSLPPPCLPAKPAHRVDSPTQEQGGQPDRLVLPSTAYHSLARSRPSQDQRLSRRPRQLWTF